MNHSTHFNIQENKLPLFPTEIWLEILAFLTYKELVIWTSVAKEARRIVNPLFFRYYQKCSTLVCYQEISHYQSLVLSLLTGFSHKHLQLFVLMLDENTDALKKFCTNYTIGFADLWQENTNGNILLRFATDKQLRYFHSFLSINDALQKTFPMMQRFENLNFTLTPQRWNFICKHESINQIFSNTLRQSDFESLFFLFIRLSRSQEAIQCLEKMEELNYSTCFAREVGFLLAAANEQWEFLAYSFEKKGQFVNLQVDDYGTALACAIRSHASDKLIEFLINHEATPLLAMTEIWQRPVIKKKYLEKMAPSLLLLYAALEGNFPIVKELLSQNGASIDYCHRLFERDDDPYGEYYTPLLAAIESGSFELVEFLLHQGATINQTNHLFVFAVAKAIYEREYQIASFLLDQGACVDQPMNASGSSVIQLINEQLQMELEINRTNVTPENEPKNQTAKYDELLFLKEKINTHLATLAKLSACLLPFSLATANTLTLWTPLPSNKPAASDDIEEESQHEGEMAEFNLKLIKSQNF